MLKSSTPSAQTLQSFFEQWVAQGLIPGIVKFSQILSTDVNGDLTVTFPGGLFGAVPVVQAQVVSGVVGDQYTVETVGSPTISGCVFKVRKMAGLSLSILSLGVVQLFQTPGITPVHITATEQL